MEHHRLDIYPIPREKEPMFINEPWLIDRSLMNYGQVKREPEEKEDNIRIYIPMDLNKDAIMRRLWNVITLYEEASEENEFNFSQDVDALISQIEIYDKIWFVRHLPSEGKHSAEAVELVKEFVAQLEEIPDACAERFPFDTIDELKREYMGVE